MRGNAARVLVPALVVLALVSVVAIAATGSTSTGTDAVRPPSATLLDTILSLGFVAVLAGAVLFIYGLTQRRAISKEMAKHQQRARLVSFVVFMSAFTLLAYWRLRDWEYKVVQDDQAEPAFPGPLPVPRQPGTEATVSYKPEFAWLPVIVVVGLAAVAVVAYVVAQRRSSRAWRGEETLAEQLAGILDDTLDDLRAETDPRRAVIAAYARLERVLAAHGAARRAAETPDEYLARVLRDLEVDAHAVRRLTDLFSRTKFSQHTVDVGMKEEAIEALEHVRDGLREAATAREEARRVTLQATKAST